MSKFEACGDSFILPDLHLVIRLDAHRHGEEWNELEDGEYPFGGGFVASLSETAERLMDSGYRTIYSYVHGDEISLLLDITETSSPRRRARLVSGLASSAAVEFFKSFGKRAWFHARLSELPTTTHVIDYFLWQRKVSSRNYLARSIGLVLGAQGLGPKEIEERIGKLNEEEKYSFAKELGISVTTYQRYGLGVWWEELREGRALKVSDLLPGDDQAYVHHLKTLLEAN